jgi:hypothetical protein
VQCTELHFASFLSGRFTTSAAMNALERKLAKHILCSVDHKISRDIMGTIFRSSYVFGGMSLNQLAVSANWHIRCSLDLYLSCN